MTPAELKTLIESDSEALTLWKAGRHAACAVRCSVIAPTVRRLVTADEIQLHASKNGTWAAITLARESSETPVLIKGVCITFLDWIKSGRAIDFDLSEVQQMVGGLIQSQLVSAEQAAQLDAMANEKQTFTTDDVQQAMGA
jgi:hypothetical protein